MPAVLSVLSALADQMPPQASWWQLAPWLALGAAVTVLGLLSSRKGPR